MSDETFFPAFMLLVGEAAGAQWGDLTRDGFTVRRAVEYLDGGRIVVGQPKTEKSARTIEHSDLMVRLLQRYRAWYEANIGAITDAGVAVPE